MKRQKRKSKKWIALLLAGAAFLTAGYALRNIDVFHTQQPNSSAGALTSSSPSSQPSSAADSQAPRSEVPAENSSKVPEKPAYQGETLDSLNIRLSAGTDQDVVFAVSKGTKLSILEEPDGDWVKVKAPDGRTGWCNKNYLKITPANGTDASNVTKEQETFPAFAQVSYAKAAQPLTVYVSIQDQKVTVVDAKNLVVQVFPCSTGMEGYETPTGNYTVTNRGESFYNKGLKEGAYYWTQFYGNYLFHSLPFDENREMIAGEAEKLGQPASHGCVRLSMDNAKWFYDNIKNDTKVVIQ